jgi:hypothetical protein
MSIRGRPASYFPDLCELAHNHCLLGATNDGLAEFFGVSPTRAVAKRRPKAGSANCASPRYGAHAGTADWRIACGNCGNPRDGPPARYRDRSGLHPVGETAKPRTDG